MKYVVNATATSGVAGTVTKATEHLFVGLEDYTIVTEVPEATTTEQKYAIALTTPGYTNYYIIGVVAATTTRTKSIKHKELIKMSITKGV